MRLFFKSAPVSVARRRLTFHLPNWFDSLKAVKSPLFGRPAWLLAAATVQMVAGWVVGGGDAAWKRESRDPERHTH